MNFILFYLKKLDWLLLSASVLLVGIGLLSLYSSSLGRGDFSNFKKQIIFFAIGLAVMFFFSFFDWRVIRENSIFILVVYIFCLIALVGLFIFAPEIRGTKSWYKIGPVSISPIEITELILIIILAKYFSTRHIEMYRVRHILLSGFYIFVPAGLVFFEPNLGSVMIMVALWIGVLLVSGIKLRHFLILIFCGIIILVFSWMFLFKDYQKNRVVSFISPTDPLGLSWSQNQAKIAIGSGGIFGQGLFRGSQTQYGFLPVPYTDFIFSSIAEETGLIGVSILLMLFFVLIWRIIKIAADSSSNFPRLFSVGVIIVLISQVFIHIGMNVGLLPIIGIPLPLVSYGGSGLIVTLASLGIVQSIKNNS